jgi:N-6 DNA Methylase
VRLIEKARKVAEAVERVWFSQPNPHRLEIPLSVVAALSLIVQEEGGRKEEYLTGVAPADTGSLLRMIWGGFMRVRPDLRKRIVPLIEWLAEPRTPQLRSAHEVLVAAVKAGQLDLTGTELRQEVDLLGEVLQVLRHHGQRKAKGMFHTPQDIALVMAEFSHLEPGGEVYESSAGTGALVLGAARNLRHRGHDPASMKWILNDADPLASALLAVNVHLWGLGPQVLVGCENGVVDGWERRVIEEARIFDQQFRHEQALFLFQRLMGEDG